MKIVLFKIFLFTCFLNLTGCYYDNEEDLYGIIECSPEESSFGQVQGIINNNCSSCHNASLQNGGVRLDNYEAVKNVAVDGVLFGVITHGSGFAPMPKNAPKLNECDINIIRQWIENGALNM